MENQRLGWNSGSFPPEDGVQCAPALLVETDATGFEFLGNLCLS